MRYGVRESSLPICKVPRPHLQAIDVDFQIVADQARAQSDGFKRRCRRDAAVLIDVKRHAIDGSRQRAGGAEVVGGRSSPWILPIEWIEGGARRYFPDLQEAARRELNGDRADFGDDKIARKYPTLAKPYPAVRRARGRVTSAQSERYIRADAGDVLVINVQGCGGNDAPYGVRDMSIVMDRFRLRESRE